MSDVHDRETRSRNMAAIRSSGTRPEMMVRQGLHRAGYRFRLQDRRLPGRPDLVLRKYNAVIFVHGCFWHRHACPMFHWPRTRQTFWQDKLTKNAERDQKAVTRLTEAGWRCAVVWECALKGRNKQAPGQVIETLSDWLTSDLPRLEIQGEAGAAD